MLRHYISVDIATESIKPFYTLNNKIFNELIIS